MALSQEIDTRHGGLRGFLTWGMFWLILAVLGAILFFQEGIAELLKAWQMPEYSHGPLIPVLSALLFLRQLKTVPVNTGPVDDRWPGVALMVLALALGFGGKMIGIGDIVAYGLILWVGAVLLISFGWQTGKHFWPPVVHLVYMLPLPGAIYYGVSTYLQGVSSEMGVWLLHMLRVPVFLEGNIIDLGEFKLHVAEACSGLRYLFPILSFSYIFAVLYQGPMWHKALLLVAAAPITVVLNSVRIAIAGLIVQHWGVGWVEGFTHFFEGWVIFLSAVALLLLLAWFLVLLRRPRIGVIEALDLDTSGLGAQVMRLRLVQPSRALAVSAFLGLGLAVGWQAVPERPPVSVDRDPFGVFPSRLGDWVASPMPPLDPNVERILAADDYYSAMLRRPGADASVELFMAWYRDQMSGGVHSPEVCLPGGGWEIAQLEALDMSTEFGSGVNFTLNRVVIQQGLERALVYFWYEQQGQRTASEFAAKLQLMTGKLTNGRQDSAIVRLITPIGAGEGLDAAEARLQETLKEVLRPLPRFVPGL
jgi:exosortase D (VPLPA-CTERM-specific)